MTSIEWDAGACGEVRGKCSVRVKWIVENDGD